MPELAGQAGGTVGTGRKQGHWRTLLPGGRDPQGRQPAQAETALRRILTDRMGQNHRTWSPLQQICLKWCLAGNWGQQEGKSLQKQHVITKLPTVFRKQLWRPSESSDMHLIRYVIFVFWEEFVLILWGKKKSHQKISFVSVFSGASPTFCCSVKERERLWLLSRLPP